MRVQPRAAHGTNNVYSRVRNATSLRLVVACGERDCLSRRRRILEMHPVSSRIEFAARPAGDRCRIWATPVARRRARVLHALRCADPFLTTRESVAQSLSVPHQDAGKGTGG
jgi:hypothetical protein